MKPMTKPRLVGSHLPFNLERQIETEMYLKWKVNRDRWARKWAIHLRDLERTVTRRALDSEYGPASVEAEPGPMTVWG
jgi:hypothetical protein